MTELTLAQQIQRLKELDAKRTPGRWKWWTSCSYRRLVASDGDGKNVHVAHGYQCKDGVTDIIIKERDIAFSEAAPDMMAVISALEVKLKVARKGMVEGVIPLEAMRLGGTLGLHSKELQQGVQAALDAIAEALIASSLDN